MVASATRGVVHEFHSLAFCPRGRGLLHEAQTVRVRRVTPHGVEKRRTLRDTRATALTGIRTHNYSRRPSLSCAPYVLLGRLSANVKLRVPHVRTTVTAGLLNEARRTVATLLQCILVLIEHLVHGPPLSLGLLLCCI